MTMNTVCRQAFGVATGRCRWAALVLLATLTSVPLMAVAERARVTPGFEVTVTPELMVKEFSEGPVASTVQEYVDSPELPTVSVLFR